MLRWVLVVFLALMLISWMSPLLRRMGLGRLPGDIILRGKNSTFYFPIVTSLLLSLVLTLVMWLFRQR